jgi:spoIIIJ-associated protein
MRIEADTLQEAFSKAASQLSCSVTQLDIKVIQHPRNGVLGMFKKSAIIEASREGEKSTESKTAQDFSHNKQQDQTKKQRSTRRVKESSSKTINIDESRDKEPEEVVSFGAYRPRECAQIETVLPQIQAGVNELVENSCFSIHVVRVEAHDEQTVLIEIDGEDAALLIGKEGYRYKAFSYLLYNWINMKYGLGIRLEIAQFLHNQEEMIENYLVTIIERIGAQGRAQTKPLDGVLIKIALEKLRARFPEKYVGIKTGREGRKFVVVNDFNRKSS